MRILLAAAVIAAPAMGRPPIGKETVIPFASGGALREWQAGPEDGIVYVRDRNERWYRVVIKGPCATGTALETLSYTTNAIGTFDRFSRIRTPRFPGIVCGVASIRTSPPPIGRTGPPAK